MILWSEQCLADRVGLFSSGMMVPNTLKLKNYDETTLPVACGKLFLCYKCVDGAASRHYLCITKVKKEC